MTKQTNLWKVTTIALGLIAYAGLATTVMTGCNTMEGLGKDIKKGGQKIEDAADRNKTSDKDKKE
jgi:entericidin B